MRILILGLALVTLGGCQTRDGGVYTLYRSSVVLDDARMHVATFDAGDGEKYNHENCEHARELFQSQPQIQTRFWCEKGRFRR